MKNLISLVFLLLTFVTTNAFASASRTLDGQVITNGAGTLTLPTSTDTLLGRATTDTLTNKSISGSSNTFTNIPTSAIAGSALSGTNTGDVTLGTASGLSLSGQVLSLQLSDSSHTGALSSTDWSTFNGKQAAGSYITALTGDVTASGPGSSAATLSNTAVSAGSYTNASITVDAKGRLTAASSGASTSPALNGGSGSPQSVTAAGGISLSGLTTLNQVWVVGSPGAVTVTKTPSLTACTADGQYLKVTGTDATKTVRLQDQANLASSGLSLNGDWIGGKDSVLNLHCDITQGLWVEDSRR